MAEGSLDVASCLARIRQQDEDAARALVSHLYPLVMKIVRSHLPRRMDEEDLAQIIFTRVFSRMDQFSGDVPFEHWVSRVAVNTCLNQLRAEKARPELRWADLKEEETDVLERISMKSEDSDPSDAVAARDLAWKLLEALEPQDRLILNLMDVEGRSVEDVREITGWGASMIKVRAFRARGKLRKEFARLNQIRTNES